MFHVLVTEDNSSMVLFSIVIGKEGDKEKCLVILSHTQQADTCTC